MPGYDRASAANLFGRKTKRSPADGRSRASTVPTLAATLAANTRVLDAGSFAGGTLNPFGPLGNAMENAVAESSIYTFQMPLIDKKIKMSRCTAPNANGNGLIELSHPPLHMRRLVHRMASR